ncbi:hypothetical protein TH25_16975 [Thalassospira profundimaris]|uniref:VWFA domain-containing protein n=1 Tax=Thalassospira profundimaris TaxID=502049 RepID=A0A367X1J5_9PROT|nr:VWA domain-containing protein [Thalassospira profundimaris]RCK46542.1 hypothetical protein TH25_16975 [Thalassospira profundimaris]
MSFNFLELEEYVGTLWHRVASHNQESYRDHRDAAVRFAELRSFLPVLFRALGGNPVLEFAEIDKRVSTHRLGLRQRIGLVDEMISQAEMDETAIKLPPVLSLFPTRDLNRDLYIWLMAWFATAPLEHRGDIRDPYHHDVWRLARARRIDLAVQDQFPGIGPLRNRLYTAFIRLRPVRKLPCREQQVEDCILRLLGQNTGDRATVVWDQLMRYTADSEYPELPADGPGKRYAPFLPVPLWGEVSLAGTDRRQTDDDPDAGPSQDGGSARKKRARRRKNDRAGRNDPLALNRFEKILSIAEMVNVNRPMDDEDAQNARKAADELEEMEMSSCKRKTATRLRFDLDLPPEDAAGNALTGHHLYPEWDFRQQRYRPDFCQVIGGTVQDRAMPERDIWRPSREERRQIRHVRRQFEAFRPNHEILRGQTDGSELDLEALVRARCDLLGTGHVNDRMYLKSVKQARDLSVAVLVDVSLSTDAWVHDRRVLDIEKQALAVLAGGLDASGDDFGIFSFTSRRRDWVRIETVKDFDEDYGDDCQKRIGALQPGYYTRLGAAIRHTGKLLASRPHQHRLMLVITDGKPNDIDHYEGRYGIEDSRRAVQECRKKGLGLFGVTIDRKAQEYFPFIFGAGGHAIVGRLENLPAALPRIYRHLVS